MEYVLKPIKHSPRKCRPNQHNRCPPRASVCDGCDEPIAPDEPILYGRKLPVLEEVVRSDGTSFYHERKAAYHSLSCEFLRIHSLTVEARSRDVLRPHP